MEKRKEYSDDNARRYELPEEIFELHGNLVYFCDEKKIGIIETEFSGRKTNVMYSASQHFRSEDLIEGSDVIFNAWLIEKRSIIPYLASFVWRASNKTNEKIDHEKRPNSKDFELYNGNLKYLSRIVKDRHDDKEDYYEKKPKKKKRLANRERSRSRSRTQRQKEWNGNSPNNKRQFREEGQSSSTPTDTFKNHNICRMSSNSRGLVRGRFRMLRGVSIPKPMATKPKLAIGRNVFPDSDDDEKRKVHTSPVRGKLRGRFIRISRGALPGLRLKKVVQNVGENMSSDIRPGLGYTPATPYCPKESLRWKRWQKLCRGKDVEECSTSSDNSDKKSRFDTFDSSDMADITSEYGSQTSDLYQNMSSSDKEGSAIKDDDPLQLSVLTYETQEVGILSDQHDFKVLFHINQVWINLPTAGFCPFAEIYPSTELSSQFYPGREVRCYTRVIPKVRGITGQAEAVWLQGNPPASQLFRKKELQHELNFHLFQHESGKFGKIDLVLTTDKHSSMEGSIQEYISNEMGLIRLNGRDKGVALFHLEQVWIYQNCKWTFFKDVMKSPLNVDYLPIGSRVFISVRKIPCSADSLLRYQAMVLWKKDVSQNGTKAQNSDGKEVENSCAANGKVPPAYIRFYGHQENHEELIKHLDCHFDNFKELAKLALKNINAVPVILNLLPKSWEAKVHKIVDDENGVIVIQNKKNGSSLYDDMKLKISKMFAIFHIDDVFSSRGEKMKKLSSESMLQIEGQEVDLTARSIVGDGAYDGVLKAASQLNLSLMNPFVACPVLQAITVFIKEKSDSVPNSRLAPFPTVLRSNPESFHVNVHGTAFFLNCQLLTKLDLKAMNFFNATCQAKLQKEIINGIPMAYFHQAKKSISTDKHEQIKLISHMEKLDKLKTSNLIYGSYRKLPSPPIEPQYPPCLSNVECSPRLLFRQGIFAMEGIMLCEIPISGGHRIAVYAFFDMSNYKFSLSKENRVKDLAEIMPVYKSTALRAHIMLVNSNNPIPYVATAIWNPFYWSRSPDNFPKIDDIYLQKYERITSIISDGYSSYSVPSNRDEEKSSTKKIYPSLTIVSRPCWSNQNSLRDVVGRVTSIIDDNYGLAVVKMASIGKTKEKPTAIILFDTCDLWLGEHTATELNLSLGQCISEGDHIKARALLVPESENVKNIRYLATAVLAGKSRIEVKSISFPEMDCLESIDNIHPDKLNNFYQVVSVVCANIPGDAEAEVHGISTDDDYEMVDLIEDENHPCLDGRLKLAGLMSMDAFEEERQKKKNAKMLECRNLRKKSRYSQETRNKLLCDMKVPNQVMWRCQDCEVSCAKPGMEKHIQSRSHWDKILKNYCTKLDSVRPSPL